MMNENAKNKLIYSKILNSIPKNNYGSPQENLLNNGMKEWRWRFMLINGNKLVEISYKEPMKTKRHYLTVDNKWVERNISNKFDKCVVKEFYCYSKN